MIEPQQKLELFRHFVRSPYYVDVSAIDEDNPQAEFLETLRATVADYLVFAETVVDPTPEMLDAMDKGRKLIDQIDNFTTLDSLQPVLDDFRAAGELL